MPLKDPEARKAYLREYQKHWYAENKEARKAEIREYKKANATKVSAYAADYRSRPGAKEKNTAKARVWRANNRERDRATRRAARHRNVDVYNAHQRRYWMKNREEKNAKSRDYYRANREAWKRYGRKAVITETDWSKIKNVKGNK